MPCCGKACNLSCICRSAAWPSSLKRMMKTVIYDFKIVQGIVIVCIFHNWFLAVSNLSTVFYWMISSVTVWSFAVVEHWRE